MMDFLRAACSVPDVQVGNVEYNCTKILETLKNIQADILAFPELCLTGYTCGDLFFQETLLRQAGQGLKLIAENTEKKQGIVIVGLPVELEGQLYNCAAVLCSGKICGIVPKTFLPNYNEFYEKRWFSSAQELTDMVISSQAFGIEEAYDIPVGRNLLFTVADTVKMGIEICEDLWAPLPPSTFAALNGAEIIVNISASNETLAKRAYRNELIRQQSARLLCAYLYTSAGSNESTADLIFSGSTVIAENGSILKENQNFIDNDYTLCADLDIGVLKADRRKLKSFKDAGFVYGKKEKYQTVLCPHGKSISAGQLREVKKLPFVPAARKDRLERCRDIFCMQVAGLKKRLQTTGCKAVVGVSGGLDSTLALLVSVEAMRQLGRPAKDVYGITMPCFGTSARTHTNSIRLMETLEISWREIDIKEAVQKHFQDIGQDERVHDLTYENSQARERTQILMDFAGKIGGLVVGTGDLSELALGWCTYNGDHMSMYGVNASIPKTLIRWMIDSIAEYDAFAQSSQILKDIVDTPISPELLPPDEAGTIAQKTEDLVGPYVLHDFFLYYVLRYGFEPEKIYLLACRAFQGDFEPNEIKKWLVSFYRRFFSQQFKRNCMPDGVKVGTICLSPRGDWRMPSDAHAALWIKKAENL